MGEKLSLVAGHIDVDWTLPLTALTGQAQVQRLLHMFVTPALREHLPLHHLKKGSGTPTRRMFFF